MSAEWFAAIVSMFALIASIYAVRRQDANADGQRRWEQDQVSRREDFEKRQAEKQNEWQKARDKELRDFEESLRTPAARAEINLGVSVQGRETTVTIVTTLVNIGQPTIFLTPPEILLPDGRLFSPPAGWLQYGQSPHFHVSKSLEDGLPNGSSVSAYWEKSWVTDALRAELDADGTVTDDKRVDLKAYWRSEAGDIWTSEPLPVPLDGPENS